MKIKKNILKKFAAELVVGHKTIFKHEFYFYSDVSTANFFSFVTDDSAKR